MHFILKLLSAVYSHIYFLKPGLQVAAMMQTKKCFHCSNYRNIFLLLTFTVNFHKDYFSAATFWEKLMDSFVHLWAVVHTPFVYPSGKVYPGGSPEAAPQWMFYMVMVMRSLDQLKPLLIPEKVIAILQENRLYPSPLYFLPKASPVMSPKKWLWRNKDVQRGCCKEKRNK